MFQNNLVYTESQMCQNGRKKPMKAKWAESDTALQSPSLQQPVL